MPAPPSKIPPAIWKALIEMPKKANTEAPNNIEISMMMNAPKLEMVINFRD